MSLLFAAGLLSVLWVLETEDFAPFNFLVGLVLGYGLLRALNIRLTPKAFSPKRAFRVLYLLIFLLREMVVANINVAYHVVMPVNRIRPAIVGVPLEPMTKAELTMLANLITLTPGTLSVEVSPDHRVLYVHALHVVDPDALCREIKQGFERRVLEAMR